MDELDLGTTIKGFIPGQKVLNRYKLERILGRGGMGVVWLARDEELERDVALKFLPEIVALDPEAVADLKRETRRNLDLTHPHIVRIHDFVSDKRTAAIAMEYVDGSTLAALKLERPGRVFTVGELRPWVEQFLEALHYAHTKAKVVHRDLKPANLMITGAGDLKITDFGIAHSITDSVSRVSKQAGSSGTPVYMSPQQMMGEKTAVTDDIYAVGATLYELLTSKPPFYSGNVIVQVQGKVAPSIAGRRAELGIETEPVPSEWEEAIAACLAKDPAARPQSGKELAERLGLAAKANAQRPTPKTERPISKTEPKVERITSPPPPPVQAKGDKQKSKAPVLAGLAAGALLLGGLGWYFGFHMPEQERLAEISRQRAWERAASGAGEEMGTPAKKDDPSAAAKKAVAEYTGSAARGSRFVSGIVRVFGNGAVVTSLKVDSRKGLVEFRASGDSAEIVAQRITNVLDSLRRDSVVGYGSEFVLARLDRTAAGHFDGAVEVNFTSAKGQPAALAFADEGLSKYQKVTLTMEILALADGDIARDAGVPAAELVKANELGSNQQRFYQLEKETGVRLLDNRQLASEGVGIPFRVSLESSLTDVLKFMQALEAGPWRIRYKEYSIVVAAPPAGTASPAVAKGVQPRAGQPWENSLGQKFVPVPGTDVLFCIWETREQDYAAFARGTGRTWQNANEGSTHPAVNVSWDDAVAFCAWLTEKERREGKLGPSQSYRLPTDAEWSVAVGLPQESGSSPAEKHGRAADQFPWGKQWPPPQGAGNYAAKLNVDSYARTSPAGAFSPNSSGLYDLGGNVWEWVEDKWSPSSNARTIRGASFLFDTPAHLASASRTNGPPRDRNDNLGFRLVVAVGSGAPTGRLATDAATGLKIGASPGYSPQPSEQFKNRVANLKISGVRAGQPSRIYVGGITYASGDVIDPALGIVFLGYDAETKLLTFKDASGAVLTRKP